MLCILLGNWDDELPCHQANEILALTSGSCKQDLNNLNIDTFDQHYITEMN